MSQSYDEKIVHEHGKTYVVDPQDGPLEVKYGLPPKVRFCKRCVLSNQRAAPSVTSKDRPDSIKETVGFGEDGICNACRTIENKGVIDWEERERQLIALLDKYRSRNGSYDCLVPGSGGKDSIYAAFKLKYKYGMNPLTCTWAPHMYTDVGWRNFQRWINIGGFDNILFTPDGKTHRLLTRLAFVNLLHPFQPFIIGQRNWPAKVAMERGIKLVFYGEPPAEFGVQSREDLESVRPIRYYTGDPDDPDLYFGGVHISELESEHGLTRAKLTPYLPAREEDVRAAGLDCRYLGYFLRWDPHQSYYFAVENADFECNTERTKGTYSKYNSIDDKIDGFHYWTGHVKFGIGRCTHEAGNEIRHGQITREEGVALVRKFDGEFPDTYFKDVLEYMSLSETEFHEIVDRFRSPHLWKHTNEGWFLRHQVE